MPRSSAALGAWAALAACVVTIVLGAGTRTSFAAFLRPIEEDLGLDRATLSAAGALTQVAYGLAQPVVGTLAAHFGARPVMMVGVAMMVVSGFGVAAMTEVWQLFLFAGILPGLGFGGASAVPATVLLARWFDRRLGLATGIMSSAIPAGQGLFVPIVVVLIAIMGWRAAYVVLGVLLAVVALPVLQLLAGDPKHMPARRVAAAPARPRAGRDIWLLGIGYFACGFTDQFVALHLVALGTDLGLDPLLAAASLSVLLLVGIVGSVVSGPLADVMAPHRLLAGLYLARAAVLPAVLLVGTPAGSWALGLFVLVFGFTYIANQAPGARLVRDRYGVAAVGGLMGRVGLAHQVGGGIGIAVGGASVALTGSYGPAVVVLTVVALVAGVLQLFTPPAGSRAVP